MIRERLEFHLENWAQSHKHSTEDLDIHISTIYGDSGISGFDEMGENIDQWAASVVETAINDLDGNSTIEHPPKKTAIHYHYGISKFCWEDTHYSDLEDAYAALMRILPEKNLQ